MTSKCFACKDTKKIECEDCGGHGQIEMMEPDIEGFTLNPTYHVPCDNCNQKGFIDCFNCVNIDQMEVRYNPPILFDETLQISYELNYQDGKAIFKILSMEVVKNESD